jgi:hypothetical protein
VGEEVMAFKAHGGVVIGLVVAALMCGGCARTETVVVAKPSKPYLGEDPPGENPVLFAPGVVSTDTREWSMASTPDGLELFFGVVTDERSWILHTEANGGRWTELEVASFSGEYNDYDLTMSPDGNRVYFTSNRPPAGTGPAIENSDLWYVDRADDGWGDPVRFPDSVLSEERDLYPSESRDGFVYFFSLRSGGFGKFDLYRVALRDGEFGEPENLGAAINTEANETDACISPDGDYLVFTSTRDGGFGSGDLYVSFRTDDGGWTPARNLSEAVNTEHLEFCPSVSRDGKYLFFTSNRPKAVSTEGESAVRKELALYPSFDRPDIDIYWIDAGFIEGFRPKAY